MYDLHLTNNKSDFQMEPIDLSAKSGDINSLCSSPSFSLTSSRTPSALSRSTPTSLTESSLRESSASPCSSLVSTEGVSSPSVDTYYQYSSAYPSYPLPLPLLPSTSPSRGNPLSALAPSEASLLMAHPYMPSYPHSASSLSASAAAQALSAGASSFPVESHQQSSSLQDQHHANPHFNMQQFLQTYYYISLRNYNGYMDYGINDDKTVHGNNSETPQSTKSKRSRDSGKISKAKKRLLSDSAPPKKESRTKKRKIAEKLEKECSCRFCYEDHILRMRMQASSKTN